MNVLRAGCVLAVLLSMLAVGWADGKKAVKPQVLGKITEVDYSILESDPPQLAVTATAMVQGGAKNVRLLRAVYDNPPEDGIQDYFLTAVHDGTATDVAAKVSASDVCRTIPKWFKGIRVHSIDDGVVVKMLK
jgi:hypothetical protein